MSEFGELNEMKTQKSHINVNGCHECVNIQVKLTTKRSLTLDELRRERKNVNDLIAQALVNNGFHFQDIEIK